MTLIGLTTSFAELIFLNKMKISLLPICLHLAILFKCFKYSPRFLEMSSKDRPAELEDGW